VRAGDDRAQRDQVSFDQHADVLVHLEEKLRERLPELRVVTLQAGAAARAAQVVRQERPHQELVDPSGVVGVDSVKERAYKLVRALRGSGLMETVETRRGGGGRHGLRSCRRSLRCHTGT
jgi:hypothetical protein